MHLLTVPLVYLLTLAVSAQDQIYFKDDDIVLWNTQNESTQISVQAENGWISATVAKGYLNFKDYLVLGTEETVYPEDGILLANDINSAVYLFHTNIINAAFRAQNVSRVKENDFEIKFQKVDELESSTAEPTTTPLNYPTPADNKTETDLTVHISGRKAAEYKDKDVLDDLKSSIVSMARSYCTQLDINLTEPITNDNVIVKLLKQCPMNWPGYEDCIQLTFALPISYVETENYMGYQLETNHLKIMWDLYANKFLEEGEEIYEEPIIRKIVTYWLIAIIVVLLIFAVLLLSSKYLSNFFSRASDNRTWGLRNEVKEDKLETDLNNHYYQDLPSFLNDDYEKENPFAYEEEVHYVNEGYENSEEIDVRLSVCLPAGESGA